MIVKPVSRLIQELDHSSFTVIGSPGADGLGTEALQVFAQGLVGAEGDFIVVPGDVSPLGRDPFYGEIVDVINRTADRPIHVMRGGNDGPEYGEYFGHANRAILSEHFVLIMVDNSAGTFSDETLVFLRDTLAIVDSDNIIVAFHYPPPNRISGDSLSRAEWERFEEAVGVWRKRITLFIGSRARTYFEDEVDGIRLIVTGGGGARVQHVERVRNAPHHALEYRVDAGGTAHVGVRLLHPAAAANREPEIASGLDEMFGLECREHVLHRLEAEQARFLGLANLARLHAAAAESRLLHARNLRRVLKGRQTPLASLEEGLAAARRESADTKGDRVAAADMAHDILAARALYGAQEAESAAFGMFASAAAAGGGGDIPEARYFVCRSCGALVGGDDAPSHCPRCGAPGERVRETT